MRLKHLTYVILGVGIWLLSSCHSSKYIGEDTILYTGAEVRLKGPKNKNDLKKIQDELKDLTRPGPNKRLLGFYFGIRAEHRGNRENAGRISKYFQRRYGEKPITLSMLDTVRNTEILINRLENKGFFNSKVNAEIKQNGNKAEVIYHVKIEQAYRLNSYTLSNDTIPLLSEIKRSMPGTNLVKGVRYDLDSLKAERARINNFLRQVGYYNFQPDYLIFKADTNLQQSYQFDLYISLKKGIPTDALQIYEINKINIFPDHSIQDENSNTRDTTLVDDILFIEEDPPLIKHKLLSQYVTFRPGSIYNSTQQSLTRSRLGSIGNYRFVNIRYTPIDVDSNNLNQKQFLDANIYLSPLKKQSLRGELQLLSKSNNFVGPLGLINYRNRNLLRGGEMFQLTGKLGFETQFSGGQRTGLNSYEIGLEGALIIPRLWLPFRLKLKPLPTVPTTKLAINYGILNRVQFYRLTSLLLSYGYAWNGSNLVSHEIHPISINLVNLTDVSPEFEEILNNNPFLRRSFEQQFILGLTYSFQYNEMNWSKKRNKFIALWNLDFSGNVINAIQSALYGPGPKTAFNELYAQYSKSDIDLRRYMDLGKDRRLVARLFLGAGFSYGNSQSMPFIKQYFSGGPNSIRAFRIRALGPGGYAPPEFSAASFFDQSGDIKFEANLEYRFPIAGFLKGGLFLDAGNIWLLRENEALPGSGFTSSWYRELAVGTGFGIRIDIGFFVIRLDIGTPLRKPFLPEGSRWISEFDIGSRAWRRDNIVYNLAIGYPF